MYSLDSDVEPLNSDLAAAADATSNDLLPVAGRESLPKAAANHYS